MRILADTIYRPGWRFSFSWAARVLLIYAAAGLSGGLLFLLYAVLSTAAHAQAVNVFSTDVQMCSGRPWIDITCPGVTGPGADPTGATDSTAAINSTITTAVTNGWPVLMPAGTYKLASKLTVDFAGQATNGLEIISRGAVLDGRTIGGTGNAVQFQCSGGTTASPLVCNHLGLTGDLTVLGSSSGYVVAFGKTDFSDQLNAARVEHLVVSNVGSGGGIQANYLTDSALWLSGSASGGSASVGGVALEQVQTSRISGYGSALGASAPALLIENGASVANSFLDFSYDPNAASCVSITSATATRNAWLAPYFPCVTAVNAPTSANKNTFIGPTFAGTNMGPTSTGVSVIGRGSLNRSAAPAVASVTLFGADDGTLFSAANGLGSPAGFAAASLPVTLPNAASVGAGYTVGFVSDANKAVVITAAGGSILIAGQQFSTLTVGGPPNALNFETAVITSDGANWRVQHLSQGAALMNGTQTGLPAHWEFPGGPGYQVTQGDNGMMVSSNSTGSSLAVTMPQTSQIQQGHMVGIAVDNHKPLTVSLNGTNGGKFILVDGTVTTAAQTFYRTGYTSVFQFDGTAFRQITGSLLGDVRDFDADPTGTSDSTAAIQAAGNAACAAAAGRLVLPPGTFKAKDLTWTCDGLHVVGSGEGGLFSPTWQITPGKGTTIDCSGMADHCIKMVPVGAPAVINRLRGNSVENISFINNSGSGNVLDLEQIESGYLRNVSTSSAPNGIRIFGVTNFDVDNIVQWNVAGNYIDIGGDISGKAANGGACTVGNCSTRADAVSMRHLYGSTSATGTVLYIHDNVFSLYGADIKVELGASGLKFRCAPGFPNLSYCPTRIILDDFETEFSNTPYDIQDANEIYLITPYGLGIDANPTHTPHTTNVLTYSLVNYGIVTATGGGLTIYGPRFIGASGSCVLMNASDLQIFGGNISGCNGGNNGAGAGSAGVEFVGGGVSGLSNSSINGVNFCSVVNAAPSSMRGVVVGSGSAHVSLTGNRYMNCLEPHTVNNSTAPASVLEANPNPQLPLATPPLTLGSGNGGLGTGGTAAASGNAFKGTILLTFGSAASAFGDITLNFLAPIYPQAICTIDQLSGSGDWDPLATVSDRASTSTTFRFTWRNNGVVPGNGIGLFLTYFCLPTG